LTRQNHTQSRNFRFDSDAGESLEFESERRGISLNSLVNNIFRKYSEFDRLAERTDMVTLNRYVLRLLLDSVPEDVLSRDVYDFGVRSGHDNLLFWKKEISVHSLWEYITDDLCKYGRIAEYDVKPNTTTLVLTHDLGPHGTIFLKSYIEGLIEGSLRKKVVVEAAGSTLSFSL